MRESQTIAESQCIVQIFFEIDMWKNKRYGKITYRYIGIRNSGIPVHEKYRCLHTKVLLLDETFAAQQKALVALLRAYPLGGEKAALDEVSAVQLLQPPVAPVAQQQQQGGQEGMLSGLQRIEEAKLLARKAEAALVPVGGGSAAALQLQRNALESLDAAEQMAELEMQKEALELEEKESRLLKAAP